MYKAKILADSVNPAGDRLTTFEITYPRFVHSELLTHRMLSRNSASSRAMPISKMIERVKTDPVEPVWWGKNQSGMQAKEELDDVAKFDAKTYWHNARHTAIRYAECLAEIGAHKQIVNRLLEPWMWITVIVSATDWWHFFNLRHHSDAQPEIAKIAGMMYDLYTTNEPQKLLPGEWHLPLIHLDDFDTPNYIGKPGDPPILYFAWISAGRCARVSYLTHDGRRDMNADYELAQRLATNRPMHASPLEHPAKCLDSSVRIGNYTGWLQLRKLDPAEYSNTDMRGNV